MKGKDGEFIGLKSPIGAIGGERKSPIQGMDLKLTIDVRLQSISHHELKKAVDKYEAESGSIVIINPKTAEILSLSNYPTCLLYTSPSPRD